MPGVGWTAADRADVCVVVQGASGYVSPPIISSLAETLVFICGRHDTM